MLCVKKTLPLIVVALSICPVLLVCESVLKSNALCQKLPCLHPFTVEIAITDIRDVVSLEIPITSCGWISCRIVGSSPIHASEFLEAINEGDASIGSNVTSQEVDAVVFALPRIRSVHWRLHIACNELEKLTQLCALFQRCK